MTLTRTARIWIDDRVVHCVALPEVENVLADAVENFAAMWEVAGRRRRPVLIDLRALQAIDRAARTHYAGPASLRHHLAVAMLIGSPLGLLIGNFFISLSKPLIPAKLFVSEPEALAWLRRSMLDDAPSLAPGPPT